MLIFWVWNQNDCANSSFQSSKLILNRRFEHERNKLKKEIKSIFDVKIKTFDFDVNLNDEIRLEQPMGELYNWHVK